MLIGGLALAIANKDKIKDKMIHWEANRVQKELLKKFGAPTGPEPGATGM